MGRKSMGGSDRVLPMFMTASGRKTGRLPEPLFAVQIGDTLHCLESCVNHGFQRFALSFNRTAVNMNGKVSTEIHVENKQICRVQKQDSLLANLIYETIWHSRALSAKIQL